MKKRARRRKGRQPTSRRFDIERHCYFTPTGEVPAIASFSVGRILGGARWQWVVWDAAKAGQRDLCRAYTMPDPFAAGLETSETKALGAVRAVAPHAVRQVNHEASWFPERMRAREEEWAFLVEHGVSPKLGLRVAELSHLHRSAKHLADVCSNDYVIKNLHPELETALGLLTIGEQEQLGSALLRLARARPVTKVVDLAAWRAKRGEANK